MSLKTLNEWEAQEIAAARSKGKEHRVSGIKDKAGCLIIIAEQTQGQNAHDVFNNMQVVFSQTAGSVTLSSGHKSKGLEWDNVFFLNSHLIPSIYAQQMADAGDEGQMQQELNLKYVIITRAKKNLTYIDNEAPRRESRDERRGDIDSSGI